MKINSDLVLKLRNRHGMSQESLAEAAGPSPMPIQPGREVIIELGSVPGPDPKRLYAIGAFASGEARAVDSHVIKARPG